MSLLSGRIAAPKSTMAFMTAVAETDHMGTLAEGKRRN
jgi:hypothetical protein